MFSFSAKLASNICKTAKNSPFNPDQTCIFPFSVDGKQFTKCSNVKLWFGLMENICATKTKGVNNEMLHLQFGVCSQECICKTAKNSPFNPDQTCIFPFSVNGTQFTKCSNVKLSFGLMENICATKTKGVNNEMLHLQFGVCSQACNRIENG